MNQNAVFDVGGDGKTGRPREYHENLKHGRHFFYLNGFSRFHEGQKPNGGRKLRYSRH